MLAVPEIKELWESTQQNKEAFSKQIDKWIEDGVAAIRDYAEGKDNDFQPKQGNSVAWVSLLKHSSMVLTQLTKSNAGWLPPTC